MVRKIACRRNWQPTPVFLPRKPHGQRSLVGYSPWGRKEKDRDGHTHTHTQECYSAIKKTRAMTFAWMSWIELIEITWIE